MSLKTVRVPEDLEARFARTEKLLARYFDQRHDAPSDGRIEIFGERYVLVRAAALSVEFFTLVRELYGEGNEAHADGFARNILFDLAHAMGKSDAVRFAGRMGLEDPIDMLTAGPVHFAYTGWAFVEIHPESDPVPELRYQLIYDHLNSFEADAWRDSARQTSFPVCIMNAGYSSGWCEESFGLPLVASEIFCRARGDDVCRFVMGHPDRIEALVERYLEGKPRREGRRGAYQIPDFFARKRMEEELRRAGEDLEARVRARTAELSLSNERLRKEMRSREEAEKRLVQTAKLEALGRLAGGIAHDFNNLMSVVIGHSSILEKRSAEGDPIREQLSQIRQAGEHAAALTQQLLTFSRAQMPRREMVDVRDVVDETGRMLQRVIGEDVNLTVVRSPRPCWAQVDRVQMTQIVMNLALNARDAMPGGGDLRIRSEAVTIDADTPDDECEVAPGDWVVVEVKDDGEGMSDDVLAHAFEPFFTTKGGSGTGLGLSTVYGIATRAGGSISISTVSGEGTRIRVFFPRVLAGVLPEASMPPRVAERGPVESAAILIVEDQTALRAMLSGLLEGLGYAVVSVRDPEEAMRLLGGDRPPPDLLLTDLLLPGMSGREFSKRVLVQHPDMAVVFMSGCSDEEIRRLGLDPDARALIRKPFTPDALAERVRQALDRS